MRSSYKSLSHRGLERLFRSGTAPSGDGALLAFFLAERDGGAFEALVARHGPMVRGVCRRMLASPHDADDAFQATFLVLVRKAAHLRDPDRLGPWLHGVATRVAIKARARAARHRHEPPVDVCARDDAGSGWHDVMSILDDELRRLPEKHREVLVLCLLQGASTEEAAHRLACPPGTVKSRLSRAREALRDRLVRRGIVPGVAVAALAATEAFASAVPPTLTRTTLQAIAATAIAPGVAALTRGVTPTMLSKPAVLASLLAGGLAVAGLGTARWMTPSRAQTPSQAVQTRNLAPRAGDRSQARASNLRMILLGFHSFFLSKGRLPAAAIYGADGQPKLSWRVALLPYLNEDRLYREFRQDEPWDSPHNKTLIARMPSLFETPDSPAPAGQTRIRGFAGPGAIFEGSRGIGLADITDGTSNTVLLAVARDAVPWTRPGELPFVEGQPLPELDDNDPRGYLLGMVDGAERVLPRSEGHFLRPMITRSGGEVVPWPPRPDRPPTTAPEGMSEGMMASMMREMGAASGEGAMPGGSDAPAMRRDSMRGMSGPGALPGMSGEGAMGGMMSAAAPSRALERRLQRVEEKLDLVLQKLDAAFPDNTPLPLERSRRDGRPTP